MKALCYGQACIDPSSGPLTPTGESIQIFAEIENCSSRMVVPKAAIYQTQTFYAKGKMKEVKQLVANLRGESLSSGKTETWSGKMLKIPPVSPSILDCSIIRVEYSLMVRMIPFCFSVWLFVSTPVKTGLTCSHVGTDIVWILSRMFSISAIVTPHRYHHFVDIFL